MLPVPRRASELEGQRARYLRTRMALAHLPYVKTLDHFDFSLQASIDERQIRERSAAGWHPQTTR